MSLPTSNFKWMTDKEISKINLGKYKADGKKGLILEVDLEYPQELHDMHNDYPVCPEKVKVSKNMLSAYCKKIAEKYNISVGLVSKLIPTLTLFRPGGSLVTSQRFLSITFRAFEIIL